jgi:uncharacterized repeat protein (TIGR01451 family)
MQMRHLTSFLLSLLFASLLGVAVPGFGQGLALSMSSTPACSLSGTATVNVMNGTPPYTYQWSGPMGSFMGGSTITGLYGGYYSVWVQDANLLWGVAGVTVAMPFNMGVSATNDVCNAAVGTTTANVTSGGTPPFSYLWSNGQTTATATGLVAGSYDVTVTDANGCFVASYMDSVYRAYVYNSSPLNISVSPTNASCTTLGAATVSNITGGTAPYSYNWSTGATTSSISNLNVGSYTVTVTDANGCTDVAWVYISIQGMPTDSMTVNPATCGLSNGQISLQIYGGTPPFTYQWSNGATTQNISGLAPGNYAVTVTDAGGCTLTVVGTVGNVGGLNLSMTAVQPTCGTANGSLQVNASGGTPPYTYLWSNGGTTAAITGIGVGSYTVTVSDAGSCTNTLSYMLSSTGCEGTIEGRVVADQNADCIVNGADFGMGGIIVNLGAYWTVTDSMGYYSQDVLPGSYSVTQGALPLYYSQTCPTGAISVPSVVTGSVYGGNDFYNTMAANVNDLRVWFYNGPARNNGLPQSIHIYYSNVGSTTLNATVEFTHDALMSLLSGGTNMTSYNSGTRVLTYNLGPVAPGQSGMLNCSFSVPLGTAIGTGYTHGVQILPVAGDAAPADNAYTHADVILGPYDPNRKLVQPAGPLDPIGDSLLTYTVEFQNTGTDTALTVVVRDTLDVNVDPLSFEFLGSSHSMTWDIDAPGYLTFTFPYIYLPDSNHNEPASHGWLSYRIHRRSNLPIGTQIKNTAAIYFDFNPPIITNTTVNTITAVAVAPGMGTAAGFSLHPNPKATSMGNGLVQLTLDTGWTGKTAVEVTDLSGKLVQSVVLLPEVSRSSHLELGMLPKGIYLVSCKSESHHAVKKLVLQ